MEQRPTSVPKAKQVGEVRSRWEWTEPSVWTDRMLTALEQGVRGGSWFSLIDKVYARSNLNAAMNSVVRNRGAAGVDHVRVEQFYGHSKQNLDELVEQLRQGTYRPQAIRRVYIPKPGSTQPRPLGIPTVRDRVVQKALSHVLEPIFERDFAESSYGFRPRRGCQQALQRVEELLQEGFDHVVDVDLKNYFDSIPHERLLQRLQEKVSDSRVLGLVESFLKAGILEGLSEWTPTAGAPQGAVLSPLLSNIYLDPLDKLMSGKGVQMVRYADDLVIHCRNAAEAEEALRLVQQWVEANGLQLHPEKTRIVDARTGQFDFLGYRFGRGMRLVRPKSLARLKEVVREKTRRTRGQSLERIIVELNRVLRGWFGYFRRCARPVFTALDGWIRRRLRSLLRKRQKLPGISRHGADEERWPNRFFAEAGLFSLREAHVLAVNPL